MDIKNYAGDWEGLDCDLLLVPLFSDDDLTGDFGIQLSRVLRGIVYEMASSEEWDGDYGDSWSGFFSDGESTHRLICLGLGKKEDFELGRLTRALMSGLQMYSKARIGHLAVLLREPFQSLEGVRAVVEGTVLGVFNIGLLRSAESASSEIGLLSIVSAEPFPGKEFTDRCRLGRILAEGTNLTRRLTYLPGNLLNPSRFAEIASQVAGEANLEVRVLDRKELEDLGMSAILAVAKGSENTPRLVVLKHNGGAEDEPPVVLVGKGVTFDSGGLSLKPPKAMEEMKTDKAGASAVLGAMKAVGELNLAVNVVGLIPLVENMPGSRAQRPGDVVTSYSGKTIEVLNTDAEGRLILADALTYAIREFSPGCILDLATLTGACVVALGHVRAGFFSNHDGLASQFRRAAEEAGEKVWQLPLDSEYRKELESKIADIKNIGGRWGGAITAAKFLEEFVESVPWCHIDMAGQDLFPENGCSGPTGFGVRSFAQFIMDWKGLPDL